jgi:hypothetical protein
MRTPGFYFLLLVPIFVWTLVVVPNYYSSSNLADFSATVVAFAVAISPVVGGDVSLFGEVTPIVLAGSIIILMPQSTKINYVAAGLALISYFLFLHLSVYFSSGPGVGLLSERFDDIAAPQKVILTLVSNVRVMAIVVCAAILGINVKAITNSNARPAAGNQES